MAIIGLSKVFKRRGVRDFGFVIWYFCSFLLLRPLEGGLAGWVRIEED